MNYEIFFRKMYADIWQANNLSKIDDYYAKDFEETISASEKNKNPFEVNLKYDDIIKQARWQKENYQDTTLDIKKIFGSDNHISVYFYSSSIDKNTRESRHRYVGGIWRLNQEHKINRVWAVITPYYQN